MHPNILTVPLGGTADSGVLAAGTVMIGRVPNSKYGGKITIIEAAIAAYSGTATINLLDLGTSGTAVAGTIVSLAHAQADNDPLGTVLATPYTLDPGDYFGYSNAAGTLIAPAYLSVTYMPGV